MKDIYIQDGRYLWRRYFMDGKTLKVCAFGIGEKGVKMGNPIRSAFSSLDAVANATNATVVSRCHVRRFLRAKGVKQSLEELIG